MFLSTAVFDEMVDSSAIDHQSQPSPDLSAMLSIWNLVADLVESNHLKENEQQQISDFYAKAGATFPRLVCLMQLYFNASWILDRLSEYVVFAEGDNSDLIINEAFVTQAESIIKNEFYVYDKTYLPMKKIANILFRIDYNFASKPVACESILSRKKPLKELIMLIDFNIFPLSTVTDKHPTTGHTYVYYRIIGYSSFGHDKSLISGASWKTDLV